MTWSTLLITPLEFVFPELRSELRDYEWFVDGVWCLEIILSFVKANKNKKNFMSISWHYLFYGQFYVGAFWFDFASTVPPMIFLEKNLKVNALHFLRIYHFNEIFYPLTMVTSFLMRHKKDYFKGAVVSFVNYFGCVILFVHFIACVYIYIGKYD